MLVACIDPWSASNLFWVATVLRELASESDLALAESAGVPWIAAMDSSASGDEDKGEFH